MSSEGERKKGRARATERSCAWMRAPVGSGQAWYVGRVGEGEEVGVAVGSGGRQVGCGVCRVCHLSSLPFPASPNNYCPAPARSRAVRGAALLLLRAASFGLPPRRSHAVMLRLGASSAIMRPPFILNRLLLSSFVFTFFFFSYIPASSFSYNSFASHFSFLLLLTYHVSLLFSLTISVCLSPNHSVFLF